MAIDAMKLEELDRINKVKDRLDAAEQKLNEVFTAYNIPADITDRDEKLSFALTEIGDDQNARKELREKNNEAKKTFELTSESIKEDFNNMTELANKKIEKFDEKIKGVEEELEKQKLQEESKKDEVIAIDGEITDLNNKKLELQNSINDEKANSVKAKDEAKELARRITETENKIKDIDKEIEKLNQANSSTTDIDELRKNNEKIASLQGEKTNLIQNRSELSVQHQDKETEKGDHEENIRKLLSDSLDLDSKISERSSKKIFLENELRLMPIATEDLKKVREDFEKQKEEYNKVVESIKKTFEERGIDTKSQPKPEPKPEPKPDGKGDIKPGSSDVPFNNGPYIPPQGQNLPIITPEQKKKENFEYITGYTEDGTGLSSEERLKRIQSELGGRDYEAMVKAFEELKKSPVKLTRSEKNKIKEMMKIDKANVARIVKDVDVSKLDTLFRSVGIQMDPEELGALHKNYDEAKYGVLDGFTQMSDDKQARWEEAIKGYANNKESMSEDERKDFERYILTPVKFGTLQVQSKEVCRNSFQKFVSKITGESRKANDIRSAIAGIEVPEGEEVSSTRRAKGYTDNLRDNLREQTEPNPPINDRGNRTDGQRNGNVR